MKPLILSFFAVILGYSLIFNEKKEEKNESVQKNDNAVYVDKPSHIQQSDSILIYKDRTAYAM